ncbi:ArnT family glycosyltransferase [Armatimonas sp.]|uniref:ArnT family glycosyltransferase n=1 Tax=Armatimonas sp. TaxID=1872638 RepID=UPI003753E17B
MPAPLRRYLPALILLLALVLRLWGIAWGLPDASHLFSYHPDESIVVGYAQRQPGQQLLDTGFYNYGSLATLTDRFLLLATDGATGLLTASSLLLMRLVSVAYGIGTCGLLILLGKRLEKPDVGLSAAALYAVAPLAIQHGHFATVDVPATFWVTASLFMALTNPKLFWCGLFAGLAAATKYNAGLVLLAGVAAWFLSGRRSLKSLGLLLSGAALGFLLGCPGVLVNFPQFWKDFTFELAHSRTAQIDFVGQIAALYWPTLGLLAALGSPLWLVGVCKALASRTRTELTLLAFVLPYLLLLCVSANQYARYALPLLPALCWLIASLPWKPLVALGGTLSLLFSLALCSVMVGPDPRDEAAVFLKQKGAASVGFATGPWFWSPPLHPGLSHPSPRRAKSAAESSNPLKLFAVPPGRDWDAALLDETSPDAVALSEIEYSAVVQKKNPQALSYLAALTARYPIKTVFAHPIPLLGARESSGLPCQPLPIDMLYPNQSVVVFTKE